MIDPEQENLISFNDCRKWLVSQYGLQRVDISTIYRWSSPRGLSGVRLEFLQIGGKRMTSHEAIARFFQNLTAVKSGGGSPSILKQGRAIGNKGVDSIELELKRRGA